MKETRWVSIASSIKNAIRRGELHAGARIPSETEMAGQWHVSPMTVHRALTELQREGWVVRRRRVGTVVADRSAQPVAKVALVFTNLYNLPQGAYLSGIEEHLAGNFQLLPLGANHDAREEARCLERAVAECSAVICYPTGAPENTALLHRIAGTMPLVFVDRIPEEIEADVVMTDNAGSILQGLRSLHTLGHTRIAYFMGDQLTISSVKERHAGYRQFMARDIGAADPERLVRCFSSSTSRDVYFDRVETTLAEMLGGPEPITAVACQQDVTLAAVLETCVHLGVSVPGDLAVLSFCDLPPTMLPLANAVHRLVQRPAEMGNLAAKRVQFRLSSAADTPLQTTRVMTDLHPAKPPSARPANLFQARLLESNNPIV